jgi:hypothetical protein
MCVELWDYIEKLRYICSCVPFVEQRTTINCPYFLNSLHTTVIRKFWLTQAHYMCPSKWISKLSSPKNMILPSDSHEKVLQLLSKDVSLDGTAEHMGKLAFLTLHCVRIHDCVRHYTFPCLINSKYIDEIYS